MTAPPVPTSIVAQPTSSRPAPGRPAPNPLLNPNQSLSGQALLNAAQQLANVQINPAINDLSKQIATNNAQTQGTIGLTGGFYNQLEPFVQKGVDQSGQIASGLNDQLKGIGDQTQTQLQGIGQGALSSLGKYVPQGDGGIANSATADLAAQIAKQQGLAAQQSQTARNFGAAQGANYQQLNNSQLGTYGLQGEQALRGIAQSGTVRNEPLVSKIAGLQAQRGALVATDLGKLRQQEVANGISRAALNLNKTKAQTTAANDKARNFLTFRGQNLTHSAALARVKQSAAASNPYKVGTPAWQRYQDTKIKQWSADPNAVGSPAWARVHKGAAAGSATKPLSPSLNIKYNTAIGAIGNAIDAWQRDGMKDKAGNVVNAHPTNAQMREVLGAKYDPSLIQAAFELEGWGHITPQTAQLLHGMGLRGGSYDGKPIRVAPAPQNSRAISRTVTNTAGGRNVRL